MNKVSIVGILSALVLAVSEIIRPGEELNYWVLAFSAVIGVLTYIGKSLGGQMSTIIGLVVSTITVFLVAHPVPGMIEFDDIFSKYILPLAIAITGVLINRNQTPSSN
jgi:hypothetical protein